jgi:protein TonB
MRTRSIDRIGAVATLGLHLVAAAALLAYEPARSVLYAAVPVMVSLITPPKAAPPVEIPPPRPKPKPIVKPVIKKPDPPPVIMAPVEAPAPIAAALPPPAPAPPVVATPPPVVPVTPPVFAADYLENPPPSYPALSRRLREEGRLVLRVLVNPAGAADEVQVRDSSGHARLDEAARDTVRRWRFVPAKRGETPVAAWVLIPISFKLEG